VSTTAVSLTPAAAVRLRRQPEAVEESWRLVAGGVPGRQIDRRRDVLAVRDEGREGGEPAPRNCAVSRLPVAVAVGIVVPVAVVVIDDVVDRLLVKPEVVADVRAQSSTPSCVVIDGGDGVEVRAWRRFRRHGVYVRLVEIATAFVAEHSEHHFRLGENVSPTAATTSGEP